ncbi:hypothetical protein [Microbacterium sp. BR1]|uniref:hypothetical protein n=1 Tax=Microbacterium sp. BR1 TaxID=1070896 RepID=UPI0012FE387B|nr:hypothetical protein [Microbacterium sp. BR1]
MPVNKVTLSRGQVRIRLDPRTGYRDGLSFTGRKTYRASDWIAAADAERGHPSSDVEAANIARIARAPHWESRDSVRITDGSGVVYEVVVELFEGRPACIHYSETAVRGPLANGDRPMQRNYLANLAYAFQQTQLDASFGQEGYAGRPASRRPDDETLLRIVRAALMDGQPARRVLADVFDVSPNSADDWIKHARSLPGSNLPEAKRGRPSKTRRPTTNGETE